MKKIVTALLLITVQTCFAQDCKTLAENKQSGNVRFPDVTDRPGGGSKVSINTAAIKPRVAKAESWIKGLLNNFTGAKLAFSNNYSFDHSSKDLYNATGIKEYYYSQMRFYKYYCNQNTIATEGESGSSVMIYFNNLFAGYEHTLCSDVGVYTINGKPVFKIYEKKNTLGRVDIYERMWQTNVNDTYGSKDDYMVIRNSDQPVFIPITRKELLLQLMKDIDASQASRMAVAKSQYDPKNEATNKAAFDAELKRIDNSKSYTKEQMAPYRRRFIETWQTEQQKLDKETNKIEADTKGAKEVVMEYMKRPAEWLGRTMRYWYDGSTYTALALRSYLDDLDVVRYRPEEETMTQVVSVNPSYYNKSLGADVPQLILVQVAKGGYPHMKKVADLIRQPGALAPLEALLNPGKSMPAQPDQPMITSSYKLNFLPKLNTLTPLIVPADAKLSMAPVIPFNNPPAAGNMNFDVPAKSAKLGQLPAQVLTTEAYKNYVQELSSKIGNAISTEEKRKADEFLKNKKLLSSNDISNAAMAAWLQKSPKASLYLYSKAVIANTSDALAANNFAAFLIMGGLEEKAVPILQYWNSQRPAAPVILSNLGNAWFRLGDMNTAMKWLQQAVKQDSLNSIANKLLCILYLKNGDSTKALAYGTRSITKCNDEQVIAILRKLDNRVKPGEIMSRFPPLPVKQFPMLERIKLPEMPAGLDDMEQFVIELNAIKQSVNMTIADIENKIPNVGDDMQQKILMASLKKGISPMRAKAQQIIMDGMRVYQTEKVKEADVFHHHLKKLNVLFNAEINAIQIKYNNAVKNLEGGEAGDEDVLAAKELARCKAMNGQKEIYLVGVSRLLNQYASRQEYISRKFFRDYAIWAPYWVPETSVSFPAIERDYLKDVLNILGQYQTVRKENCEIFEPLPIKEGELQEWEDEYCANFKGKIGFGPGKVVWNCNSWAVEAGEGIVGGIGMNYNDDGSFEDFYVELGLGASWNMGEEHIAKAGAGATVKEFVKFGTDKNTGEWEVKDAGVKGEIAIEGEIGNVGAEAKVIEVTAGYRSGITKEGLAVPLLNLK